MIYPKTVVLALGLVVVGLAGCVTSGEGAGGERLSTTASFAPGQADAIVIMGIMANDGGPVTAQAVWDLYDPATRRAAARPANATAATRMWMRAEAAPGPGERQDAAHAVFRVQPGDYILTRLMGNVEQRFRVTDVAGSTLRLSARAGEIVYVGDLIVTTTRLPLRIATVNRNERAARAALAAYPNIRGEMKMVPPEPISLAR
jgi:hypothetical protein